MQEMQETWVQSLDQEDPLEEEMETHFSILTGKIPRTGEPGGVQPMGLQRVRHDGVTERAPGVSSVTSGSKEFQEEEAEFLKGMGMRKSSWFDASFYFQDNCPCSEAVRLFTQWLSYYSF